MILLIIRWVCSITGTTDTLFVSKEQIKAINWNEILSFFSEHAIVPFVSDIIRFIPEEYIGTKKKWKESVYTSVYNYSRLLQQQNQILLALQYNNIPVVVLKGTSAAQYYPKPQLRTIGDIDLLVKPDNYEQAVACLVAIGCIETSSKSDIENGRHRCFHYRDVMLELHYFFSFGTDEGKSKALDMLLFDTITNNNTVLPDEENGLVLLSHIRQHLEDGLGLRQIIDWLMFVRCCLNDKMWYSSFKEKAHITGLEDLAIITTKMCQKYLGLTTKNISWCNDADEVVCDELLEYVMKCGNFGRSLDILQPTVVEKIPPFSHPIQLFKYIQSHGETNWKALKKHPYLKPFAWIYQSCRYIKLAIQNKVTPNKLKAIYDEGNKRNEMFAALGLK